VHGANPPRTRPTPIAAPSSAPERGFWRRKKAEETPAAATAPRTKPNPAASATTKPAAPKPAGKPKKTPPDAPQSLPLPPLPDRQSTADPQSPADPQRPEGPNKTQERGDER
jgi:small conductance mechanosensitive channel